MCVSNISLEIGEGVGVHHLIGAQQLTWRILQLSDQNVSAGLKIFVGNSGYSHLQSLPVWSLDLEADWGIDVICKPSLMSSSSGNSTEVSVVGNCDLRR